MHLQGKRGLSLIELVVTVGILGLLSTISIPMYHQYRVNAREAVFKTDLQNLHKSWQTFGVHNNFCADEKGKKASIDEVGMASILVNGTYGENSKNGPNFIGFGSENDRCKDSATPLSVIGTFEKNSDNLETSIGIGAHDSAVDTDEECRLMPFGYAMGVYGYIGETKNVDGDDITHRGFMITHNGILSESSGALHERNNPPPIPTDSRWRSYKPETDTDKQNSTEKCCDGSTDITFDANGVPTGDCPSCANEYTSAC